MGRHGFSITLFCALSSSIFWNASAEKPSHGFSYFGDLKYPKDMDHYDYVNPDAPKGGVVRAAMVGTFNNLNPYVDKGSLPDLLDPWRAPLTHEPLMSKSEDELAGYYGRLAESIEVAMVVPGSGLVKKQAEEEGLDRIFINAGIQWREPGCSMCLAMNADKLEPGERCASTSNRNFEGRQGFGSRTHLVSPAMAAAAAITGRLVDVRDF